ncbi:extracellular solute-binding protein [Agromyces sp. CFH 90414]|uniref:Extracellular solute-binding protein n=1 Tax=Agromyces agglutinans TaxID=2662258 RepID=A0A6I2FA48_9MICO|nr:sugar ABC transporter substrate-binding protein [Agromyces agglutinans]MRG59600.1 extracellular solute-binding protein [Agromyces agglutinans]
MTSPILRFAGAVAGLALAVSLAGCSASDEPSDGTITLRVSIDAGLDEGATKAFEARAAQFEEANPDITIEPVEYTWDGTTFAAALAGGTLPDVFTLPFTDGRGLIANEQIADISDLVAELPYAGDFNPNVAVAGQAEDGSQWAVPIAAYGQGLHYNRALFEQAGLDPDQPPTTWDEVREYAKQIADATGQAGYAQMTTSNTGGWILTTLDYALGGRLEEGSGDVASTIDTPEMAEVLEMVHEMRWTDDSMGANFLYDWGGINQAFASGQIGMYVSGGGNYGNLFTQNQMNPDDYGLAVLPLADSPDAGVLGGGTLAAVSGKADDAHRAAGVEWIDFYYMEKLTDEDAAVADAEALAESGAPVGAPQMPIFDQATYEEAQSWVADLVNVPLDQMTGFTDHIFEQPLIAEPSHSTQEVYALLDPVVQAVLTDQNADIAALLAAAEAEAQQILAG